MNFTLLKQWATSHGYEVLKEKGTEVCLWTVKEDPSVTGIADTLRDTATQIYNHITNDKWVDYQNEYKRNKEIKHE